MIKRLFAPTAIVLVCLALGSCASFSGVVSDNWPTWAGGMPKDVPPRPGAPGYAEFIAHQKGDSGATAAAPAAAAPATGARAPAANASAAPAVTPAAAPVSPPARDQAAVQGGLY